jgi:hypothetical protein
VRENRISTSKTVVPLSAKITFRRIFMISFLRSAAENIRGGEKLTPGVFLSDPQKTAHTLSLRYIHTYKHKVVLRYYVTFI